MKINILTGLAFFAVFSLAGCQKELVEPDQRLETLTEEANQRTMPTTCTDYFYNYNNQQAALGNARTDYVTVIFPKGTSQVQINNTIKPYKFLKKTLVVDRDSMGVYAVVALHKASNCLDVEQNLWRLEQNPLITYANPFLQINPAGNGQVVSYANEFIVSLAPDTPLQDFEALLNQTNTEIVEDYGFGTYVVGVTENSPGDALEMANYFYNQSIVEVAEPNFLFFAPGVLN